MLDPEPSEAHPEAVTARPPLCGLALLGLVAAPGCDWAAADGPWNQTDDEDDAPSVLVSGSVCTPNGLRGVPGVPVSLTDAEDTLVAATTTDPWGAWQVEVAPGRYTVLAGTADGFSAGSAVQVAAEDEVLDAPATCFGAARPQAFVLESAASTDRLGARLTGLGLTRVHEGPSSPAAAGQLLGSPQGLEDYGIAALLDELDLSTMLSQAGAVDGLRDHVEAGGLLFLVGDAVPALDALLPGAVTALGGAAVTGWVGATVEDAVLEEHLQWSRVGVPYAKDTPLFQAGEGDVLLRATLEGPDGPVTADLLTRFPLGDGTIVLSSIPAPTPRADGWWIGDPEAWTQGDGSWDGRGAVLDRVLLAR